jgi:DNA-binding NarL/FixJ family response regulator
MKTKTNLLIADDHPLFRAGVKQALSQHADYEIAEVENGKEAIAYICDNKPVIAILDIRMPQKTGLEVLADLYEKHEPTRVILLTMHKNIMYFYQAVALGVKGYLLKETAVEELSLAVKQVESGGIFISSRLSALIESEKKLSTKEDLTASINSLTKTEREVMKLVGEWKTNSEIAEMLFISARTAGNHRTNISSKLNLHGNHSLIRFAIENKDLF